MPSHRLTVAAALLAATLCGSLHAAPVQDTYLSAPAADAVAYTPTLEPLADFATVPALAPAAGVASSPLLLAADDSATADAEAAQDTRTVADLRRALIAMAMQLRDTRYVRGGRDPSTGFDCSGFVRYVFAHAVGMQLPTNSAAQFLAGLKVKRADMEPGDLVFFHTRGKQRVSHVGIYLSEGRFIHSPTTGKSVEISSMDSGYWAKRFVGAKRPEAMALASNNG